MPKIEKTKVTMLSRRHLAEALRQGFHEDWIKRWFEEIMFGRDPRVTLKNIDPSTNRMKSGRPTDTSKLLEQVPTLEQSIRAFEMMLMRRDGAPAQQIQLDQDLRARTLNLDARVDLNKLATMEPETRRALISQLRGLLRPAPGAAPADVASAAADGAAVVVAGLLESPASTVDDTGSGGSGGADPGSEQGG